MSSTEVDVRRTDFFGESNGNGNGQAMVQVASTRAAQEVQAAMVIAKKFPRDEERSIQRILQACRRKTLAECAVYAYPKGGQTVEGPSIRMAEVLAQAWGNVDFGVIELEQRPGESTMMSYAWDLETNTRQTKIFAVKHERHTRQGKKGLDDPRDIYEMTANQGARRLRACILGIIPGDVIDAALAECNKTMQGNNKEPLIDRVRAMTSAFAEWGVSVEMIERRLGHRLDATSEAELAGLRKIYRALKDNMASREDYFPVTDKAEALNQAAKTPNPTAEGQTIDTRDGNLPDKTTAEEIIANAPRAPQQGQQGGEEDVDHGQDDREEQAPEVDLSTPESWREAMTSVYAGKMDGGVFNKLLTAVELNSKVKRPSHAGQGDRERYYAAAVAGKVGADGKIAE